MKKINLMKSAAAAALFSLVALFGCNNNATVSNDYSANGQIFGYVTDTKGEPLSGVTIALGNQTATTNQNGAFALTGVPANATQNPAGGVTKATNSAQEYELTATKDGYLSKTEGNILVVETTDKSDAAVLLGTAADAYKTILQEFAKQGGAGVTSITNGATVATDGVILDTQNTNDTFKGMADAYATVLERYQNLSKTYESTFVHLVLPPCNGYFEGTLKITKSPGKDITTDAASIKAAPEGVKVKLVSNEKYVYEAITDKDGKFKFEKLPVATNLTLKVEGFEATYESGEGENKVTETYYYSSDGNKASLYDNLQEDTFVINLDENSGAKYKADILLYSQPAKIIVTDTNLLQNTAVAPLALNTPVTFTFNKPMDYVALQGNVVDFGDKAAYAWDETKKTVKITPKDGFWTVYGNNMAQFMINGRAQDGSTTFIKDTFEVTLDNVIKVKFADVSDETADKFTLTFDRELDNPDDVKVTDLYSDEALELSWNKTDLTKPVLTVKARDGKFGTLGYHTFKITGVKAKDQSTNLISYNKEYVFEYLPAGSIEFKTSFDGFKATGIEVVNKAEGNLSRAVVATTAQYLKITFNKNVGDVSGLQLKGNNSPVPVDAEKYIKDNAVYISLSKVANNASISLSGTVTSTSGDTFDGDVRDSVVTWADLLKNYNVKRAYVIAASNLYTEKSAINAGNNNVVTKIKKGDKVTLTFNNEIPADAVITAELYKATNEKIDATGYSATATADKNVVTVTLSETKPGATYYLSLKIKSADGAELFSTASNSFATGDYVKDIDVEKKIADNGYIKIVVDSVELLKGSSSKTTKLEDFSKSNKSNIVLQFNQDVTGYKAYLYVAASRNSVAKAFEDLTNADKANFYDTKYEVSGDTITITPNASFSSGDKPAIAVYDEEGNWVELDKDNLYQPYQPYKAKTYADKLALNNIDVASIAITANKKDAFDPAAGDNLYVSFDMPLNKYTKVLPEFDLYKKVDDGYGEIEWVKQNSNVSIVTDDTSSTQYDFSDAKADKKAWIKIDGVSFGFGKTVDYVLVAKVNNMLIKSNTVTITKK